MRDLKFRGWESKKKEWVHGFVLTDHGKIFGWSDGAVNVLLSQYTGLKDKNGVEIFEGDIVRYNTGEEWTIKWSPMYLRLILVDNRKGYNLTQDLGAHEVEVIGNIYEKPELLV